MNALVPLEAEPGKDKTQIQVKIPDDLNLAIPETNNAMVGMFEGYTVNLAGEQKALIIDIHPNAEVLDFYNVNDDAEFPSFIIELRNKNIKKTETKQNNSTTDPLQKIEIKKKSTLTAFRFYTNTPSYLKASQLNDKILVLVPKTNWAEVETHTLELENPAQDISYGNFYKDYHVNEENPDKPQLIIVLENNAVLVDQTIGEEKGKRFYEISIGIANSEPAPNKKIKLKDKETLETSKKELDPFSAKPAFEDEDIPEPLVDSPIPPRKSLENQNPMARILEKNPTIQTSKEGPVPEWVLKAQGTLKKMN